MEHQHQDDEPKRKRRRGNHKTLTSQLKTLATTDSAPQKRPFARPSILFDPKEAADKSTETIYTIAAQGNFIFHIFLIYFLLFFISLLE
jgi:hypothetical protein